MAPERPMVVSRLWFQAAIVTFALGFGVLVWLAWRIQTEKAPIPDRACQRTMAISFWGLNIGLLLMILLNLVPLGGIQIYDAFANGYWHARDAAFFQRPVVRVFEWLRLPGDTIFIVAGILPVVYLALRMFIHRKRVAALGPGQPTETFTTSM